MTREAPTCGGGAVRGACQAPMAASRCSASIRRSSRWSAACSTPPTSRLVGPRRRGRAQRHRRRCRLHRPRPLARRSTAQHPWRQPWPCARSARMCARRTQADTAGEWRERSCSDLHTTAHAPCRGAAWLRSPRRADADPAQPPGQVRTLMSPSGGRRVGSTAWRRRPASAASATFAASVSRGSGGRTWSTGLGWSRRGFIQGYTAQAVATEGR